MKIKALKTGWFAHPQPCKGRDHYVDGFEYDVDSELALSMIETGWASEISDKPSMPDIDGLTKAELEALGVPGVDADGMKKTEMIEAIEEYYAAD